MCIVVLGDYHKNKNYIDIVNIGWTRVESKDHKVLYKNRILSDMFKGVGFKVKLLEYFDKNKNFQFNYWDKKHGIVHISKRSDKRNKKKPLSYTSIILDPYKE